VGVVKKNHVLFIASFVFSLSGNILSFSLVYLLIDRFDFTPSRVGTYFAVGSVCYFLCCNLYRRFGTTIRPTLILPAAVVIVLISSILLSLVRDPRLAILSYALIQGGTGFFWPPIMAWFTQGLDEAGLNRDISIFNRSWMSGNLLGPPIAGALYHWSSVFSFLAVNCGYALALGILILLIRGKLELAVPDAPTEPVPVKPGAAHPASRSSPPPPAVLAAREKAMDWFRYRGWIGAFCANCFVGVLVNIVPLHIRDGLGYTERTAGMVLFIRCISGLVGFTVLAKVSRWHFNRRWFLLVQSALVFCALAFLPAGGRIPFYFSIIFIYGFVHSCCYNNSIFHSSATGKNPQKNMALHEIFLSMGSAAGAAGGGFCYQHFGFAGTFAALGVVLSLGLAFFVLLDYHDLWRLRWPR
jgi:predicted MFS family arabinose efflux permease